MSQSGVKELHDRFGSLWIDNAAYPALLPETAEDILSVVSWCLEHEWKILPVGHGHTFSARFTVPPGIVTLVSLGRAQASEADPHDLVVECESGVPSKALNEHVRASGFRLEGWPDEYEGTVGGLLCGDNGPSLRPLILGVDLIDGRARSLRFGGRIRKNVTGFDIPSLIAGSRGRIGWLDRVYLRLTPLEAPKTGAKPLKVRTATTEARGLFASVTRAMDPKGIFLTNIV